MDFSGSLRVMAKKVSLRRKAATHPLTPVYLSVTDLILSSLVCQDPDEGSNGNCSLKLVTDLSIFKLNGSDLTVDGSLVDYEALSADQFIYKIAVLLTDHPTDSEARTSSTTIDIKVS